MIAGKYRLERELGRGTFGAVYAARVEGTGEAVAVKLLSRLDEPEARERFAREVAVLTRLPPHRNVVRVLDSGTHGLVPFLVLELVPGGSLASVLASGWRPTVSEAAWIAIRLAPALTHLHEQRVVHRDVNVNNVLVGAGGEPKLVDFGLALDRERQTRLTTQGDILGTPVSLAPEQLLGGPAADDPAVDTYALSALLYVLLTGRTPFAAARTMRDLARMVVQDAPPPPETIAPLVPPGLARLVERGLAKDPLRRPRPTAQLASLVAAELAAAGLAPAAPPRLSGVAPALPASKPPSERGGIGPGTRLGPYEVVDELGRGGLGVVYRGRAPDGSIVAIKLLSRSDKLNRIDAGGSAPRDPQLERFEREERLLARLGEAEGFVPFLGSGESAWGPYIVMPYVSGGTLEARLRRGPLAIDEAVALGRSVAAALGRAHALGIVHRDVKPANILFREPERGRSVPLLADLGLAKHFRADAPGASASAALSRTGEFRGTPGYMPPEQMSDAREVGPPGDVFALGATLFESLAGVHPFAGHSMFDVITRVAQGRKEPLARLRPDAPAWLVAVIEQALATDPATRFADGTGLARALEAGEVASTPPNWRRKGWITLAAAATIGGAGILAARAREPEIPPLGQLAPPAPRAAASTPAPLVAPPPPGPAAEPAERGRVFAFAQTPVEVFERDAALERREVDRGVDTGFQFLALAPAGGLALSGRGAPAASFWDLDAARERSLFLGHAARIEEAVFAPDGKTALTASDDGGLFLWTVPGGEILAIFIGHQGPVRTVAYSLDGKRAISGGGRGLDRSVRVWPLEAAASGPIPATPPRLDTSHLLGDHDSLIFAVGFSADARRAFSVEKKAVLRVWEVETGADMGSTTFEHGFVSAAAFSADGRRAVVGTDDGHVDLLELDGKARPVTLGTHNSNVTGVGLTPDGTLAVTSGKDRTLRIWDLAERSEVSRLETRRELRCPEFALERGFVYAGLASGAIARARIEERR
jgi:serine/threonine protein kinase